MNKLYKIPFCYEEGCYLLKDICVPDNISDSECMILEYEEDCDIISNNINDIRTYQLSIDILGKTEIIYRSPYTYRQQGKGNNLDSVCFIYKDDQKLPIFFDYNEKIYSLRKNEVFEKMQECIELCSSNLTDELKKAPSPLPPMVIEYFFEGSDSNIVIMDAIDEINYTGLKLGTSLLLNALLKSVPNYDTSIIFYSILMSVYNRLCFEIPDKYHLSDNYQLFLPERYD
jgi:hypothetical protein